jgi:outer membrane protein TolC
MEDRERTATSTRPEIRQAQLAQQIAETQAKDARAAFLPEVIAHGAFETDRRRFYNQGGVNWLVSVGLRWNLFNGGADKARVAESEAARRQSSAEQARADSTVRLQVRQAWAALRAAQQRIETASASTAEAEESLRISQNRYAAGLATVTDLLRAETALMESQTRRLNAIHDQRVAAAMLEFAAGTLSPESEVLN